MAKKRTHEVKTRLNVPAKDFYTPEDVASIRYDEALGDPGEYPYTRGPYRGMYRDRMWVMRELVGFGNPSDTSERVKMLTKRGTTGIAIIADLATYMGVDPDHPLAEAGVGLQGIPLHTLKDMETFLDGIPMEDENPNLTISSCTAPIVLAQYLVVAQQRGIDISKLKGNILNDAIKGRYSGYEPVTRELDLCLRSSGDVIEYCLKHVPSWNSLNIQSFAGPYGASIPLELALQFAIATAHVQEAIRRGIDVDQVAPRISFLFALDMDFFESIAEMRASRKIWARLMKERFGAKQPRSQMLRIAVHGPGMWSLYPQEPLNNLIRLSLESLAAVLGGCQSLQVCGYDEPICLPTEESHLLSLRIQQIIGYETGVTNVADPLAGSYFVEYLTSEVERQTLELMKEIDEMGGILEAIKRGWPERQLDEASLKYRKELDSGERLKVAVNFFRTEKETQKIQLQRISPEIARIQIEELRKTKETRDNQKLRQSLMVLYRKAGEKKENLMPYIMEAVRAYGTTAEINGTIRQGYGYTYDPFGLVSSPFDFDAAG